MKTRIATVVPTIHSTAFMSGAFEESSDERADDAATKRGAADNAGSCGRAHAGLCLSDIGRPIEHGLQQHWQQLRQVLHDDRHEHRDDLGCQFGEKRLK
jgi:hypothetical protein